MGLSPLVVGYAEFTDGETRNIESDIVVVKSVPVDDNIAFVDLVLKLGGEIPELELVAGAPVEDKFVYCIGISENPIPYESGSVLASTTDEALPLHVDGVNREDAYDCIALLTMEISAEAPFTLFMTLDDIKQRLPQSVIYELSLPQWPFRYGYDAILRNNEQKIYFNPQLVDRWISKYPIEREKARHALSLLKDVASHDNATELPTSRGDCVIVANTRVLHGRREVPVGLPRKLKRIRFDKRR